MSGSMMAADPRQQQMMQAPAPQQGNALVPQLPMQPPQGQASQGAPQQPPPLVQPVVGGGAARNPNLELFRQAAMGQLNQRQGPPRLTPAEMARLGRFGDQVVAHLTPGEIQVPPEVQSPKVLATLEKAFTQAGVQPEQFVAGSPQSSVNPNTGAPEYSFLSAILPVAGAVVGSIIPGIGTAAGMALGGAAGGALGGVVDKTGPLGILGGAAGGALGGYLGGSGGVSGLLGSLGGEAASAAPMAAGEAIGGAAGAAGGAFGPASSPAAAQAAYGAAGEAWKAAPMTLGQRLMGGMYAGIGSGVGSSLAPPQSQDPKSQLPDSFKQPLPPVNPNYGQLLGSGQTSAPNFTNYDPFRMVAGNPYRFFPVAAR